MKAPIVFMFSGQGSHYYQMGRELYLSNGYFASWMRKLDEINKNYNDFSIIELLYKSENKKSNLFDRTLHTSPALFMVQYSLAQELIHNNITPDYVLGTSLGEFVAAAITGVVNYEEALYLVIKQAQILEKNSGRGGMIAILDDPGLFYGTPALYDNSEIASINYDTHFIVSGDYDRTMKVKEYCRIHGITHQALAVSYGFHSTAIDTSKTEYLEFLKNRSYKKPMLPFVSSGYASVLQDIDNRFFWNIIRKKILFSETITYLESQGEYLYLDLGPSGTLKGFVGQNLKNGSESKNISTLTPFGNDLHNLEKAKHEVRVENGISPRTTSAS